MPVLAASTPSQCFHAAIEAARIALKYRTPVYLLSDAYLANGSEPWLIPQVEELPDISTEFATPRRASSSRCARPRDAARPWALPAPQARAPDRRSREGGRDRQRLLRPREPRPG